MTADLDTPTCPVHLEPLQVFGRDPEGRDARWECVIPSYRWAQTV